MWTEEEKGNSTMKGICSFLTIHLYQPILEKEVAGDIYDILL